MCNCAVLLESTECSTQADSPKVNVTSRRITTPRLKGSAKDKSIYVCALAVTQEQCERRIS